ncbi:hypothetical protein F9L07_28545 [Pimelobacter simplex]|uniref:Uncharacterized protein n=1 Tax=Nocardioides simplex TaxID=2045 RepID=A0A7J5DQN8_NOCSI|nr:hypothetical protein [Pimelobacter simplex]KAB2806985.1 hypothetical protein F9L07_28545 [Pimelobacter simplex]
MPKAITHQLDIYGVHLHLATDRRQWSTLRRKLTFLDKTVDHLGLTTFATWVPNKPGASIPYLVFWIDLAAHATDADLINTLAHEASHGAGQVLDWVSHKVPGTDEPHAYLVGWLTEWLWTGCLAHRAG